MNDNIKEVLAKFPEVAAALDAYNIGCVTCSLGTCLLKDIVGIHNLPPEGEKELMSIIARIIFPESADAIPKITRKTPAAGNLISYSPPMKVLVDEHTLIKRWLALIPEIVYSLDLETDGGRQVIAQGVDFIRSYADKYHHAKEEDILFRFFDGNLDVLKAMNLDHETGRGHVRAILTGLNENDEAAIAEHLNAYRELITEHIGKEDGILFPWMDRNLSMKQVGELFKRFNEKDTELGGLNKKYEAVINKLEKEIKLNGVAK